ncbi:hypothetical protein QE388_002024 [Microbacterium sp. SORGH_AS 969]|nr:hypothetical protein [Microbacterium sp. SORGH_AS_0969]
MVGIPGRPSRGRGPAHARQSGRAVGGDARHHEARRRDRADDDRSRRRRPRRSDRAGRDPARHRRSLGCREVRRPARRSGPHRGGRSARGMGRVRRRVPRRGGPRAASGDPRRRPPAALLHVGDHVEAEARRAHARVVSRGAPLDDVLAGSPTRRRAPRHQLAGVGEARVESLLRAVDRRGHRARPQLLALLGRASARRARARPRHDVLRSADRVAHADPGRPRRASGGAARGRLGGRAAQPRGHRDRAARVGPRHPRRLRPDRDDRRGREQPREPSSCRGRWDARCPGAPSC